MMIRKNKNNHRTNHQKMIVGGLLACGALLLIASFENSSITKYDHLLALRRLAQDNEDDVDLVEQLSTFYELIFNYKDAEPNNKFLDLQKSVRIRRECEAFPDKDTQPKDFVGTDHLDSHLTTISCVPVHYRIPTSSVQGVENSIVFGILSDTTQGREQRDYIRQTWAQGNTVFFLVAGDWNDIQSEYEEYRDILWVDQPEQYRDENTITRKGALTFKSEAFLIAMHNQVVHLNPNVEYFFKTDDGAYIDVNYLQELIQQQEKENEKTVDYWGQCHDDSVPIRFEKHRWYVSYKDYPFTYFPTYCIGAGYVVSPKFLQCTVGEGHVEKVPYLPIEDGAVGLLAEKCDIQPSMDWLPTQMSIPDDMDLMKKIPVYNDVKTGDLMKKLHENFLRKWSN